MSIGQLSILSTLGIQDTDNMPKVTARRDYYQSRRKLPYDCVTLEVNIFYLHKLLLTLLLLIILLLLLLLPIIIIIIIIIIIGVV